MAKKCNVKKVPLLLTGCICPPMGIPYLKLYDEQKRLEQYIDAIKYYINLECISEIVFCENSDFEYKDEISIQEFARRNDVRFEWIRFRCNEDQVKIRGKGFGEGELIKYAISHSKILGDSANFIKITGRLKVINLEKIISRIDLNKNYFNADLMRSRGIDTRFYCVKTQFYKSRLLDVYQKADDLAIEMTLERLFFDVINLEWDKVYCLPLYPKIDGMCAGTGDIYTKKLYVFENMLSVLCAFGMFNRLYIFYARLHRWFYATFFSRKYRGNNG